MATTDDVATAQGLLMRPEVYFDVMGPSFQRVIQGYKALGLKVIKHYVLPLNLHIMVEIETDIHEDLKDYHQK